MLENCNSNGDYNHVCHYCHSSKYGLIDRYKSCIYCYGFNKQLLLDHLLDQDHHFVSKMRTLWAIDGCCIWTMATDVIKTTGKLTPQNVLDIVDKLGYPRHGGSMVVFSFLEKMDILPTGTYKRLKLRGFKPCGKSY